MSDVIRILWPDRRTVDAATIVGWALDARANEELGDPQITDDELRADPAFAAHALDQAGLITLAEGGAS